MIARRLPVRAHRHLQNAITAARSSFFSYAQRCAFSSNDGSSSSSVANENSSALIRKLREKSSAPMKDVKAALVQSNWDIDAAFTELRKKGLTAVSKKATRVATEGLLAVSSKPGLTTVIELNSETDFVARNDIFQHLASRVASAALSLYSARSNASGANAIDLEELHSKQVKLEHPKLTCDATVQEAIHEAAAIMGENLKLRRGFCISAESGLVSSYLHMSPHQGLGKTAGILTLEAKDRKIQPDSEAVINVGDFLAMHIVASRPLFLSKETVTQEVWDRERNIILSQVEGTNKPKEILEKMIDGRLRKYAEEVVFLEQKYVMDEKVTVKAVLENLAKQMGFPIYIGSYLRLEVGETVDREDVAIVTEEATPGVQTR